MLSIDLAQDVQVSFMGPPLEEGPLPAVFYFALSANESLLVDPYNQPVVHLAPYPLRIFSMDLPYHGTKLLAIEALGKWAGEMQRGNNPLSPFLNKVEFAIRELIKKNVLLPDKIATMGLSRGGFIACHAAARMPFIQTLLGFAPLIQLLYANEFKDLQGHPIAEGLELKHLIDKLYGHRIRFYIGNRDVCVGTKLCFQFVESLVEKAFHERIRSPKIELLILPSIGHRGHGTSKESFTSGAAWIAEQLMDDS